MKICHSESTSTMESYPNVEGKMSVDILQLSVPPGTVLAADGCLAQGQALPRAALVQ